MTKELKVTSLEDLKKINSTDIVELGEFDNGLMLTVEMKKLNVFNLVKSNKLPNSLLNMGTELVGNPAVIFAKLVDEDPKVVKDALSMTEIIMEQTFVNPKYKDIVKVVELTSNQINSAVTYAMGGMKALEGFRNYVGHNEDNSGSEEVQETAERDS